MNTITVVTQKQGKTLSGVILGVKESRLRIRNLDFPFSLHQLAAQVESGETTQDPEKSAVQLGGRGVSKAEGRAAGERLGWS